MSIREGMRAALRHPVVDVGIGIALGGVAVGLLLLLAPWPQALSIPLPGALADLLGATAGTNPIAVLAKPEALWLMPAAVLPYLILVLRRSLVDVPGPQVIVQLLARLAVLMAVATALAQPSLRSPIRGKTLVFAIDLSDSIDDAQLAQARAQLAQGLAQLKSEAAADVDPEDRTRVAVVTYAERAEVHTLDVETSVERLLARPESGTLGSDHASALRLAAALVDPQTEGRIVLLTDGGGSLAEREDLSAATAELQARGVSVHVRRFEPAARGDVLVEAVHLPAQMRLGETFNVAVDVFSTDAGTVRLALTRNGVANPLQPFIDVELRGGPQQLTLEARVTEPGPVVFEAALDPASLEGPDNRRAGNDAAAVAGEVRGRPKILLAGSGGNSPLAAALRSDHLDVTITGGSGVPETFDAMRSFDLVMFSDLAAGSVSTASKQALKQYVVEHGGGFIMVGGDQSFGMGGWGRGIVGEILPVRFEGERQREQPKLALVLVIDKSGSMSSEDKLDLVKEASRATARTLDPSDEIGVIAFDSRPHNLVRLQPAANRIRISSDIRRLTSGGGTNALPALREAYLQLAGSNALVKHVILLSDGQSPENGISALLGDMRDADITVSSVGVGAGAGKDLLRRVARRGRGRFYYSHDGTDVPRIFSRETREVTRNAAKELALYPRVSKNVQALRGIDFSGAPGLRGLVPVKAKAMTETLLRTHQGDPLLVRGRRGLGRTAAFASDAKARWAAAWLPWSGFAKLWSQLARDTMRQGASLLGGASIAVTPSGEGGYAVSVDVAAVRGFANDLQGELEVLDPSKADNDPTRIVSVPLRLSAPGRYVADVGAVKAGQRLVKAQLYDVSQEPRRLAAEALSQVSVPYPTELLPSAAGDASYVSSLQVTSTAGSLASVVEDPGEPGGRERQKPLWPWVLAGLVLPLLIFDLLLRRISFGSRRITV
ncbi:MAG: VWA domain-containing protein [Nannocystaceae bacterium]|nr:VWA domain-containing protein [Nannocystaceae bacterium]